MTAAQEARNKAYERAEDAYRSRNVSSGVVHAQLALFWQNEAARLEAPSVSKNIMSDLMDGLIGSSE